MLRCALRGMGNKEASRCTPRRQAYEWGGGGQGTKDRSIGRVSK